MNMQKPRTKPPLMRFCTTCRHRTPHDTYFNELEVEHLVCSECGTVTHLHPA